MISLPVITRTKRGSHTEGCTVPEVDKSHLHVNTHIFQEKLYSFPRSSTPHIPQTKKCHCPGLCVVEGEKWFPASLAAKLSFIYSPRDILC